MSSGAGRRPTRLDIQTAPCAEPRSVVGIQSAIIRENAGNVPAWNAPNRKRSDHEERDDQDRLARARTPRAPGRRSGSDPPRMIAARMFRTPNRSARNPQGISKRP